MASSYSEDYGVYLKMNYESNSPVNIYKAENGYVVMFGSKTYVYPSMKQVMKALTSWSKGK